MPVIELPLTSDGERKFTTEIAGVSYLFRTTYVMGQQNHWVLDIFDANENPLVYGINIVTGSLNLLKGYGNVFDGIHLLAVPIYNEDPSGPEALGTVLKVLWYTEGEDFPYNLGDPLLDIDLLLNLFE
jgi:hypothetical protein